MPQSLHARMKKQIPLFMRALLAALFLIIGSFLEFREKRQPIFSMGVSPPGR